MKHSQEIPDRIVHLATLKATGKASAEELSELDSWLGSHPDHRDQVDNIIHFTEKARWLHLDRRIDIDKRYSRLKMDLPVSDKKKKPSLQWLKYAALLVLLVSITFLLFHTLRGPEGESTPITADVPSLERNQNAVLILSDGQQKVLDDSSSTFIEDIEGKVTNKPGEELIYEEEGLQAVAEPVIHKLVIPAGARYQLKLSDGTKVWLNSVSELEYPVIFGKDERRVVLQGEAYFDVQEDIQRPFIVELAGYEIKVLGTEFNISSYPEDRKMEATLVEGSVSLSDDMGRSVLLAPKQQAMAVPEEGTIEIREVETKYYTSWKDGILHFHAMPLADLCKRLERWYDAEITIETEETANLQFSGAIENSKELDFLLHLISQTTDMEYNITGNKVYIK